MTDKITTPELEKAVVRLLNPRLNAIVPNVSWGLGLRHECDLLALDSQNRFTEVELKISRSDLKKDFKKPHGHCSDFISRLAYAVPDYLLGDAHELVPKQCGIIVARKQQQYRYGGDILHEFWEATWVRIPRHVSQRKPDEKKINKFLRLGTIRIWNNTRV